MTNKVLETIKNRRSVRHYLAEKVEKEKLEVLIEAGREAPSAHNVQQLHFTVITDTERISKLSDESKVYMASSGVDWAVGMAKSEKFNIFYNAPAVIVVSTSAAVVLPHEDSSAALENMLIAAESLDLGACWIGLAAFFFADKKNHENWGIPTGYTPMQTIAVGYPNKGVPVSKVPRKPLSVTWL